MEKAVINIIKRRLYLIIILRNFIFLFRAYLLELLSVQLLDICSISNPRSFISQLYVLIGEEDHENHLKDQASLFHNASKEDEITTRLSY